MRISKRHVVVTEYLRGLDKQNIPVEVGFNFTKTFVFTAQAGVIVLALIGLV